METDTLQEAERRASMSAIDVRLTRTEEQHLTGIPVLDEEASEGLRPDEILVIGPDRVSTVPIPDRESAPMSTRGRLLIAREMLARATQELDAITRETSTRRLREAASVAVQNIEPVNDLLDAWLLVDEEL